MNPTTITINNWTATEFISGSWYVTGPTGQSYYPQGSADDITKFLQDLPPTDPSSSPLIPSANVGSLPDGSTQIETLQQATADRQMRRAALEPDYVMPDEASLYTPVDYQALQAAVLAWNDCLNQLRADRGMSILPDSAFDGSIKSTMIKSAVSPWAIAAGAVLAWLIFKK